VRGAADFDLVFAGEDRARRRDHVRHGAAIGFKRIREPRIDRRPQVGTAFTEGREADDQVVDVQAFKGHREVLRLVRERVEPFVVAIQLGRDVLGSQGAVERAEVVARQLAGQAQGAGIADAMADDRHGGAGHLDG
ncbi:MAG: hypothetical protein ACK55I_36895, partial [bacterium]